jgi:hypothetical protein
MRRCTPVQRAAPDKSGLVRPAHLILRACLPSRFCLAQRSAQPIPARASGPRHQSKIRLNWWRCVKRFNPPQAAPGGNRGARTGRALPARCARIALIITGSSMHAMMRIVPPQPVQVSTSMPNTRFTLCPAHCGAPDNPTARTQRVCCRCCTAY